MTTAPLPWHREQWEHLLKAKENNRLPHAVLLRGPQGVGKEQFANAFSEYLLCSEPVGQLACGTCKSCMLLAANSHPDFLRIEPEEAGKMIKIDQVRAVASYSHKTSQFSGYRIVYISPAEAMNNNAANALLKSLEEPGKNVMLLLVTHNSGSLLATLKSRCQQVDCPLPPESESLAWLEQSVSNAEESSRLLRAAGYAPLQALEYYQGDSLAEQEDALNTWVSLCSRSYSPLVAAEQWMKCNDKQLFTWLFHWSLDCLKQISCCDNPGQETNTNLPASLSGLVEQLPASVFLQFVEKLQESKPLIIGGNNLNRQLFYETLALFWQKTSSSASQVARKV